MNAVSKLMQISQDTGRFCTGEVVLTILDAAECFPELARFADFYRGEIATFEQGTFPITPNKPAPLHSIPMLPAGSFVRLPKQYRRFFARTDAGWRSFKGFDPYLGYQIAHGQIDIHRGADSPWGMKWLSGQIYTSILTWAIHAEHVCRFGTLASLPLPVLVADIKKINWLGHLQSVEEIDLGGNRNYLWTPGQTDTCKQAREGIVQKWIDALPDTMLSQAIRQWMDPAAEGLGGVMYDMHPLLRLQMPTFFTSDNLFQQQNYASAIEYPLERSGELAQATLAFMGNVLRDDSETLTAARAENLGVLIGLCCELKINVLSFGVEASNIAIDGSLPDLDTIQYRKDSIEWLSREPLPYVADFRYTGIRRNLQDFEAVKAAQGWTRVSDHDIEMHLRNGLCAATGGAHNSPARASEEKKTPTEVMQWLDETLRIENTIVYPALPRYELSDDMPWPEGLTFLKVRGVGNNPPEVWFTLALVGDFAAMEVHHRDHAGVYNRLPGDYFHTSLTELPRSFLDYLEEYIRLFLNDGISEVIFYPDHIQCQKEAL
jgi:hypothetical protein